MGRNNFFKFKQFTIYQEKSAMKVGTDGILLGAWAGVENCERILDIGTGTGLIALMLAQRSKAQLTAIEIEEKASIQARQNVNGSRWANQIEVKHISLQDFVKSTDKTFDLIVSNPPFFNGSLKAVNHERTTARHNIFLPFEDLVACAFKLLNSAGKFAVILPNAVSEEFVRLAQKSGFNLLRETSVKPNPTKPTNRMLLEFTKKDATPIKDSLTIYNQCSEYSSAYVDLTRDFYLKF